MGLFTKIASKAPKVTKKPKGQVWDASKDPEVNNAINEMVKLHAESRAIDAKLDLFKGTVKRYADSQWISAFVDDGAQPESPISIQDSNGQRVTYVVQDRAGQYKVSDEQRSALDSLLGENRAQQMLYDEMKFSFSREILAIPGVQEAVEKALESLIKRLVEKGTLTEEQAENLIEVDKKVAFVPGVLPRLHSIVGGDAVMMRQLVEVMGSSVCRYVKP